MDCTQNLDISQRVSAEHFSSDSVNLKSSLNVAFQISWLRIGRNPTFAMAILVMNRPLSEIP